MNNRSLEFELQITKKFLSETFISDGVKQTCLKCDICHQSKDFSSLHSNLISIFIVFMSNVAFKVNLFSYQSFLKSIPLVSLSYLSHNSTIFISR
jgi:hypothetical protein